MPCPARPSVHGAAIVAPSAPAASGVPPAEWPNVRAAALRSTTTASETPLWRSRPMTCLSQTPLCRVAAAADFGNGIIWMLSRNEGRPFINPDLTIYLHSGAGGRVCCWSEFSEGIFLPKA
jgi:hypothetical protein